MADDEELSDLTVDELTERAKKAGVTGYSPMNKKELVKAVRDAEADDADDAPGESAETTSSGGADSTAAEPSGGKRRGAGAARVAGLAMQQLAMLIDKPITGVLELERDTDDGWRVVVEVAELRRVPNSTDVLASYETHLDADGELQGYRRLRRYIRAQPDEH